jgi:tyrosyl-tRNA synthetase
LKDYLPQIGRVLDLKKIEVRYNSEWLGKLDFREIAQLAQTFTIQQMLERKNFKDRTRANQEIGMQEMLYPLMQGYDSVAVKADVELGGTDQLFNLLAGRKIQERYNQKPQDLFTTKMVLGLDGRKMSTSWGNVINLVDEPEDQFGKVMSLRDSLIPEYFEVATDLSLEEIADIKKELKKGTNPKTLKERLGFEIVRRYHGETAARKAQEHFAKVFSRHEIPDDLPNLRLKGVSAGKKISALDIVVAAGVLKSKSEARRLIEGGGFECDKKVIKNPLEEVAVRGGEVIRIGKKLFFKAVV